MITTILAPTDGDSSGEACRGADDVRRVLEVVVQALSVIAPVTARLHARMGDDDDAVALERAVGRAVDAIRTLQPVPAQPRSTTPTC